MSFLNANSFLDRQAAAAKARKEMAEKFLSRPKYDPSDPAVLEREAKRREILESRAKREEERQRRKAEAEAAEAGGRARGGGVWRGGGSCAPGSAGARGARTRSRRGGPPRRVGASRIREEARAR